MLLTDIKSNPNEYNQEVVGMLKANNFKDESQILQKAYGKEWKEKCEKTLFPAKQLGNIYVGSLYGGLMHLICDKSINLMGKKITLFSYGSGCAASLFFVRVVGDYSQI